MERIQNVNLQPLKSVRTWDTKRVVTYKNRIQAHISYLESTKGNFENFDEVAFQKFKNYEEELKNILLKRENVE
jgi:hypothetical protein